MRQLAKLLFLLALAPFNIGGLVPAGGTQARTSCKLAYAPDGSPASVAEQEQSLTGSKRCSASRGKRGAAELIMPATEFWKINCSPSVARKTQTEVVCALPGTNLRSISDARTSMHSYHDEKSPRQCPGLSISSTRV